MYCKTCGNKINPKAIACPHCGCATGYKQSSGKSKKGPGVLSGMFTGVIGLVIGMCLYESDTVERKTFMKGWTIGFVLDIVAVCVFYAFFIGLAIWG